MEHPYMNEIFRIIEEALRLDIDRVRTYASLLAEKLEKHGELATAKRLRKLLAGSEYTIRPCSTKINHQARIE